MKALIVAQAAHGIEADQIAPFLSQRSALARQLGLQFVHVVAPTLAEKRQQILQNPSDLVFIQTSWRENTQDALCFFRDLCPSAPPMVYLDSFDSTATPLFGILPYVALYVKKQILKDVQQYTRPMAGGYIFTDYLSKRELFDIKDWNFGSLLNPGDANKVFAGWNVGTAPHLVRRLKWASSRWSNFWPFRSKQLIDISCRSGIREDWYGFHRQSAVDAVGKLKDKYRVIAEGYSRTHGKPISRRRFQRELRQSKISVSPFGWGEICFRDFESIICNCLVVKPSMSHVQTTPNTFVAGETYVPVEWDFSDLEEKCDYYLARPGERQQITRNARRVYQQAVSGEWFVPIVQSILERIKP